MDPFSIIVGTTGVADVSLRLITYLTSIKSASTKIQDEITILNQEITALGSVNDSVEDFWRSRHDLSSFDTPADDGSRVDNLWRDLASLLQQSKGTIEQLEVLLKEVVGKKGMLVVGKIDGLRKTIRKQDRDGEYMQIRQRLTNNQAGIQMLLNALNLCVQEFVYGIGQTADLTQLLHARIAYGRGPCCRQPIGELAAPKRKATNQNGQSSPETQRIG